ncbi:MAG: hypothetical protein WKF58_04465 [Ilumatobacteraceae bacterium]
MKQERAAALGFGGTPRRAARIRRPGRSRRCDPSSSTTIPTVDAMLLQHPTPPGIDYEAALAEIDPDKDADGAHPLNMGRLALGMAGPGAVHAGRHRRAARPLRDPGGRARGRRPRPRVHVGAAAVDPALAEAARTPTLR